MTAADRIVGVLVQPCEIQRRHCEACGHLQHPGCVLLLGVGGGLVQLLPLARLTFSHDSLVTFFIAIFWVCAHHTSGVTRISVSIVAVISIVLLVVLLCNSDWKSQPGINSIATKMKTMQGLVKRAPVTVATRLRSFSRSFSQRARSLSYTPRRRKTRFAGSDPTSYRSETIHEKVPEGDEIV